MDKINIKDIFSGQTLALSLQHLLAMYAGAVIVPIIVGNALGFDAASMTFFIAVNIFVSAIATLIQAYRGKFIGIGLPAVFACSATAIGPMIQVGSEFGLAALFGAVFVTGIIIIILAPIFARLLALFPPLVTSTIVTLIGLTLIPVAINYLAGGEGSPEFGDPTQLMVGFLTFLVILLLYRFTTGFVQSVAVLIGLVVGIIIAWLFGIFDTSAIQEAGWFQLPVPFYFSGFEFNLSAIVTIAIVGIVSMIEATGIYSALSGMTGRSLTSSDYQKGYLSLGISYLIGGMFNTAPFTAFSQNVGVINMSGVKKREVIYNLVILMLLASLLPKIGAVAAAIPGPVLGGAMIFLFGNIISYGIGELGKIDMNMNNQVIVAVSLTLGVGVTVVPEAFAQLPSWLSWATSSGIITGALSVVLLNLLFNGLGDKEN